MTALGEARLADLDVVTPAPGGAAATPAPSPWLETAYRHMVTARAIEDRARTAFLQGKVRGRFISGLGQEAIPVGATLVLEPHDVLAPHHRDLGAHLVRGSTPVTLFRHWLCRATGPARGRDSDVHFGEWDRGVLPMVSHLPDSFPVLAGVALGFRLRREPRVALGFCGDGATSTGTWHETMNFAAVNELPMVFVVEDNQYAYSTPTDRQFRAPLVTRAAAYGMAGAEVDGNDVEAVAAAVTTAVDRARGGGGPTLLVAETMRMEGHAIHDGAGYVPPELLEHWKQRDPVALVEARLRTTGWDDDRFDALRTAVRDEVRAAWDEAEAEPLPAAADLEDGVYASPVDDEPREADPSA